MLSIVSPLDGIRSPFGAGANVAAGPSAYAIEGFEPPLVVDSAGILNGGTEYYRANGATIAFADLFTFARASAATYVDSSGVLQTAATGVARRNHHIWNGSAWVNEGVKIESAAATNVFTHSSEFDNAAWAKINTTVSANAQTSPDGTTNADTLDAGTSSGGHYMGQTITPGSTVNHTFSIYAKQGTGRYVQFASNAAFGGSDRVVFDLLAGAVTATGFVSSSVQSVGGGWYRLAVTALAATTSPSVMVWGIVTTDAATRLQSFVGANETIHFYGTQAEVGSIPTSYIPTSGSTVTRAAETLTIAGALMPYSATAMSFQMQGRFSYADLNAAGQVVFARWYADANNYIVLDLDTDGAATGEVNAEQAASATVDGVALAANYTAGVNVAYNIASRHTSGAINVAKDGTAGTANETPVALPALGSTVFQIGTAYNGTVGLVRGWDDNIGDAGLEGSTS